MNDLFQCDAIITAIERAASENETGEISEDQMQAVVEAHTQSMAQLEKLVNYLGFLDGYIATGQGEIERIGRLVNQAKNRMNGIKRYVTPYIAQQREKLGRPLDVGTHRLSVRKSESVEVTDVETFRAGGFPNESRIKTAYEPDKQAIEAYIEKHGAHPGAEIRKNVSLIIK